MREIVTSGPGQPERTEVIMSREELRELDQKQLEANGRIVALKAHAEILEGRIQALESKNDFLKRQVESWKDRHEIAREDVFAEEAKVKERVQSEMAGLRSDRERLRSALREIAESLLDCPARRTAVEALEQVAGAEVSE